MWWRGGLGRLRLEKERWELEEDEESEGETKEMDTAAKSNEQTRFMNPMLTTYSS
jgi:hypothetical protein